MRTWYIICDGYLRTLDHNALNSHEGCGRKEDDVDESHMHVKIKLDLCYMDMKPHPHTYGCILCTSTSM